MGLSLVLPVMGFAPRTLARMIVPPTQFPSFDNVITNESSWNIFAINPSSGAYGLGQALPPQKMAPFGADWAFNPATQIRWAYTYMCERYGGPDGAWAFWQAHHWY